MKLKEYGIPNEFPAIIHQNEGYKFYYFAGDFADNSVPMLAAYFDKVELIDRVFYTNDYSQREKFFWELYLPIMKGVLREITIDNKEN